MPPLSPKVDKVLVVTRLEDGPEYAMYYVAPNHSTPIDGCAVIAKKGFPLECGRHGQVCECVDAVVRHARQKEDDMRVASLVLQGTLQWTVTTVCERQIYRTERGGRVGQIVVTPENTAVLASVGRETAADELDEEWWGYAASVEHAQRLVAERFANA